MHRLTSTVTQPAHYGVVSIALDGVEDYISGELITIEGAGVYTVLYVARSSNVLTVERKAGLGDGVSYGSPISSGTRVYRQGEPVPLTASWEPVVGLQVGRLGDVAGFDGSSINILGVDITKLRDEVILLRAEVESVKKEKEEMVRQAEDKNLHRVEPKGASRKPWLVKAVAAQELKDLVDTLNKLHGLELIEAVNRSASLHYEEDPSVAGLITAALDCFPNEPTMYYAAIARYKGPAGGDKEIVGKCKAPTLEGAIRGAAQDWIDSLLMDRRRRLTREDSEAEDQQSLSTLLERSIDEAFGVVEGAITTGNTNAKI